MDISTNSELFKTFDGIKLFEQSYAPEENSKGIIVVVHGLHEHSGVYSKIARDFSSHHYKVNLFDLRGHGKSDGLLAFIDSFDDYLDDLSVFLNILKKRYPRTPVFLLGQGMGGVISALYVIERKPEIRGLILSAPSLDIHPLVSSFQQKTSRILGKLFPRWPLAKINSSALSEDPSTIQEYENDPLIYHGKIYARTCSELIKASKTVMKHGDEIKKPVLIVHGEEDKIFNFEASRELYEKVKALDKTIRTYEETFHLLLLEPSGGKVFTDIVQWTDSHVRSD